MPDSYWRGPLAFVVFGLALAVIAALLIWDGSAALTEQRVRYDETSRSNADQAADRIERNCGTDLSPALLRDCVRQEIEAAEDSKRAERDLDAQEVMARFTRIMGYTGLIGLVLGLGSVYLIWATLRETQRMAVATRDIGEAQVRTYLSIQAAKAYIDERDGIVFDLTVTNSGQSPAKGVHAVASVWVNRPVAFVGDVGQETGVYSVEIFSRSVRMGDIQSGGTVSSGLYHTHDLSFPADVVRNKEGIIQAGPGNIAVFATDVFGNEVFEVDGTRVAEGAMQFRDWEARGNFSHRLPFGYFGQSSTMRSRGWKDYEPQNHQLPWES